MRSVIFWALAGYHVTIDADSLGKMPREDYKRLLQFARSDPRNGGSLQELRKMLQENVTAAEKSLLAAQAEHARDWRYVDRRSCTPAAFATARRNRELHQNVKCAKADLSTAKTIWNIFNETE